LGLSGDPEARASDYAFCRCPVFHDSTSFFIFRSASSISSRPY